MSSASATIPSAFARRGAEERIDPHKLVAFLAMLFGMFMAILDIQIVSASLSDIQAGLSASNDEISWVQTAYLWPKWSPYRCPAFLSRALGTRDPVRRIRRRLHRRQRHVRTDHRRSTR